MDCIFVEIKRKMYNFVDKCNHNLPFLQSSYENRLRIDKPLDGAEIKTNKSRNWMSWNIVINENIS